MKSLIGKEWVDSSDGKTIDVINPATGELVDTVPSLTVEDVNRAVDCAREMQKSWENKSVVERCEIISRFAELVKRDEDKLAKLLSDETGKPLKEAYNEVRNIQIGVPAYVERVKHDYGNVIYRGTEAGQENTIQYTIQQPLGVVVAIIPFNFPSDIFINKVPPALLMGNSVILKPASVNPLTLTAYVELLVEAGVPAGVIEVVHGSGSVIGTALTKNPKVDMVTLTGSTEAGIDAARNCAEHCAHSSLELGGNDAFIICADGDLDLAVEETVWGRLYNTGQVCCASKRFLVENSVKDQFIEKMIERIKKIKYGMPSDPETEFGCLISEEAAKEVERQVNQTIEEGARLVIGGERNKAFYTPTILDGVTKDMAVAKDMEIFGPVIPIITSDMKKAIKVSEKLECGGFVVNGASFFRSFEQPFGGWKYSGIGNEGIMTTLREMSRTKTVILKNITK